MKTSDHPINTHFIFITDESGIGTAFVRLKSRLSAHTDNHVSLVYFSQNNVPIFSPELTILQRHFPTQFIVYFEKGKLNSQPFIAQQTIEAILNENTREVIQVFLFGNEEFVIATSEQLRFLGIEKVVNSAIF